jgi:hypothetical protein
MRQRSGYLTGTGRHSLVLNEFATANSYPPHVGRVIVDTPPHRSWAFPVWAPRREADSYGRFVLPRADDERERIVITCSGHAARAVTVAEVEANDGRIELQAARTVRLEVIDCNGRPLGA